MTAAAAVVFVVLATVTAAFQVALAAGAPWGRLTWGGRFPGMLPPPMRVVAMCSAVLLSGFAFVVALRAGFVVVPWAPQSDVLVWVVVAYCAIGVLANAATPSPWERRIWLPVVAAMLASCLVVAVA